MATSLMQTKFDVGAESADLWRVSGETDNIVHTKWLRMRRYACVLLPATMITVSGSVLLIR